ncbi:MAG: hypothetical protein LBM08_01120 [Dysgonamonadaceae bacterium]|jgi:hypothetical protein|nr:hypothetical protein [Dysgonamonadaceae bacterium]
MKKMIFCMVFILGMNTVRLVAQEQVNYIIVKSVTGEVASFNPSSISRLYIEEGKWVFEMKESGQKYDYSLEKILPFTMEMRSSTSIDPVQSYWNVYDDGNNLVIVNVNGIVGNYTIYDIYGRLLESGYGCESKITVNVPSGGLYVVKANGQSKKTVKK